MNRGEKLIASESLILRDVIKRPVFKKNEIIAGNKGLLRKVNWVHVLEITNTATFVNQNDLILTTGIGIHQSKKNRLNYLQNLISQGAAGLCIELGIYLNEIPNDMIELANQYDFPLIVLCENLRFVDITQDIHSLIINQQHLQLKKLEAFSRKLQQLTLQSTDIYPILRHLHEYVSLQVLYYSEIDEHTFYPQISPEVGKKLIQYYKEVIKNEHSLESSLILVGNKQVLSIPVVCLGQTLAYVGIICHNQVSSEWLPIVLDYTSKGIAQILLRKFFLEENTYKHHNELFQDLLLNKIESEELALQRLGIRHISKLGHLFIGGVIELAHNVMEDEAKELTSRNQDLLITLRSLLKKHGLFSLLMLKNNLIYLIIVKEYSTEKTIIYLKESLVKCIEELKHTIGVTFSGQTDVHIGFGTVKTKLIEIVQSFKEAFDTLSIARVPLKKKSALFYDDLGIYQIIKSLPEEQFLASFIEQYLGKLIEYDFKNQSELLHTIDIYLKCQGSKQDTAKQLFIHRQTLYHRLDKIEELIGNDFLDEQKRQCIEFALRAYELLHPFNEARLKN